MKKFISLIVILLVMLGASLIYRKHHHTLHLPYFSKTEKPQERSMVNEYLLATVAERTGDTKNAIDYYEKALLKDPENSEITQKLYGLYLFEGDYDKAIKNAKRQYEIDKINKTPEADKEPIAYLLLALNYLKNNDVKSIPPLLEPIVDPTIPDKNHLDGVIIPMVLAWSYVVDNNYTSAFKTIDNVTTKYMLSVFAYNRALMNDLANNKPVLINGKNYSTHDKAEKFISELFFEIGQYSLQNYSYEEAVVYFRLARFLDPDAFNLKNMLALTYESMGKLDEAIKVYREVPESSDNYGDVLLNISLAEYRMGNNDMAIKDLEKLQSIKAYEYQALMGMGMIKLANGQYKDAIKYFEDAKTKIKKEKPENWTLYFNLGVAYEKTDDWQDVEDNLKKSVELYPENPESLNYLAYSWLIRNKNVKQARTMLESAVIRSGGAPHILDSYGWALYKLGYAKEAIPFLEQASNGMPYSTVINDHLGDVYWAQGRKREAKFQWQKAYDGYDKDEDVTSEISKESIAKKLQSGL